MCCGSERKVGREREGERVGGRERERERERERNGVIYTHVYTWKYM